MPPLYATVADFEAYVPGWVTDDADTLEAYLETAERDLDRLFPLRPIIRTGPLTGRRFDLDLLQPWEADALRRAVCAQAEFLIDTGPEVAAGTAPTRVKGPDFEVEHPTAGDGGGGRRRYSAVLERELLPLERYRARTARLAGN